ncbi:MAG: hypothetical protein HY328_05520 [Chloroflexi bacterium]|nr:hypothetical protein [Chloroflexota bacterium]
MKLVTFIHNGHSRIGALAGDGKIVDLNRADPTLPTEMLAFLAGGAAAQNLAEKAVVSAPSAAVLARAAVTLQAPIPRPGKILCIGLNYRDHAAESNQPLPEYPTVFAKYNNLPLPLERNRQWQTRQQFH